MNIVVYPNAKINIGLHITEKREDGFHNIETLFYPCEELTDILEIVASSRIGNTSLSTYGIPRDWEASQDLCVKAYDLIKAEYDIPPVEIHLYKQIPVGAGLGGGSSDAAFTISALNKLFSLEMGDEEMERYAARLGSDCSFFIKSTPLYAEGRGTELSDISERLIENLKNYKIKIITPKIKISTAEAYAGIIVHKHQHSLRNLLETTPIENWRDTIVNDFEKNLFKKHPELASLKGQLYNEGATYASMSGSGSSVYGLFYREC